MHRPTYAEIDLNAIAANVRTIRKTVGPGVRIMPAVKADGYGHGSVKISRVALGAGADMLGVASVEEALELRNGAVEAPILILGCSTPDCAPDIVEYGISATICDIGSACDLSAEAQRRGKKAKVHVKVDTGMGRIGVPAEECLELVTAINGLPMLDVEGVFTHFPSSDEPDRAFTENQISQFKGILSQLDSRGMTPPFAHAANSAAVLDYPSAYLDMVRPGLAIYGWRPSQDVSKHMLLKPSLTFKTKVVFLKELPSGKTISYGRTFTTSRVTKVATIPVGYADGYDRALSNRGEVAVKGYRAPVIGRVCMDQTLVDVTDVPGVAVGDDVVLLGGGYDYLSVERVAEMLGTVPHDIITSIGKRVPRVYVGDGSEVWA